MSVSSTQEGSNSVVWGYGEKDHVKLTIDNHPRDDTNKPRLALINMSFTHLHSPIQEEKHTLSLLDLKNRLITVHKCKETMDWLSGDAGYALSKTGILGEAEGGQVRYNAGIHAGACEKESLLIQQLMLEQLYREVESEQNANVRNVHRLQITALEELLGVTH